MKTGIISFYFNKYGVKEGARRMREHGYDCVDYQNFVNTETDFFKLPEKEFEKILKEGKDILCICFSSGLSTTYNSARIAAEMLTALGLGDALSKRPAELSGGMQQRVSLARALVMPHRLLLLDEPFRGLDSDNRRTVTEMIRTLSRTRPVLLVTHDPSDAEALDATVVTLA